MRGLEEDAEGEDLTFSGVNPRDEVREEGNGGR
jgi:hypothetical protein